MPAGTYRIQVEVNRNNLGDEDITYEPNKQGTVVPVLTPLN